MRLESKSTRIITAGPATAAETHGRCPCNIAQSRFHLLFRPRLSAPATAIPMLGWNGGPVTSVPFLPPKTPERGAILPPPLPPKHTAVAAIRDAQ